MDIDKLSKELGFSKQLLEILIKRGFTTKQSIKDFLFPDFSQFSNPYLIDNMDRAVARLSRAIANKEKILIYGDRDVDGVVGVSILFNGLKMYNANLKYFIPESEYGFNVESLKKIIDDVKLVITCDCGTNDYEAINFLLDKGIDVIITDHHKPEVSNTSAILINPHFSKLELKEISGAFTAYKLLEAYVLSGMEEFKKEYVVFDIETTGLSPILDEIVEIGAVKLKNMIVVDEFSVIVKTKTRVSAGAYSVHKIKDEDIKNGVELENAIKKFIVFSSGAELVAHNANFDVSFMKKAFKRIGLEFNFKFHDTLEYARKFFPFRSFSLSGMAQDLGIEYGVLHRAGADARLTAMVFSKLFFITNPRIRYLREKFSELVALSTISDVMPLIKENRSCVYMAIKRFKKPENEAIRILVNRYTPYRYITEYDIAYEIVPVINSCGRLNRAGLAARLFIDLDESILNEIDELNETRKKIEREVLEAFLVGIKKSNDVENDSILVAVKEGIPHGTTGIAASRIASTYRKPVILLIDDGTEIRGSARSYAGFDLYMWLKGFDRYFLRFGGHKYACGLSVKREALQDFIRDVKRVRIPEWSFPYDIEVDGVDKRLYSEVRFLRPFGYGNENPVFLMRDVEYTVNDSIITFKKNGTVYRGINLCRLEGSGRVDIYFRINSNNIEVIHADT